LATTEPYKVLPTILSRCQRFDFSKIDDPDLKRNLIHVLEQEGVEFEEKAVDAVVTLADGGMRDALSILEQVLAYSGDKMTEGDVLTLFGLTSNLQKIELLKLVEEGDVAGVLGKLEAFLTGGVDIKRLNSSLLDILKDLLIFQKTGDEGLMSTLSEEEAKDLSSLILPKKANKMISLLLKAQNDFRNVSNIRSLFELTLLQLCSVEEEVAPQPIAAAPRPAPTPKPVEAAIVEEAKPEPKVVPQATDVPSFVAPKAPLPTLDPEEKKEVAPEPVPAEKGIDVSSIKESTISNEGDSYKLTDEDVINIMVLSKDCRMERRDLTKAWSQLEALKGHETVGNLATLLAEGHPFALCKEALLLTFDFTRLRNKANIKANQPAIQAMVEQLLGRKVFVYALDRHDCNKYYTNFTNLEQLNRLPNKKDIELKLPEGE
jgi:DNA polymerase-3 subunit gamma/tau